MDVKIVLMDGGRKPIYKRDGDANLDCYARIAGGSIDISAHSRCLINLGFCIEIPDGFEGIVKPRSGNTLKGYDIGIGTIDPNYRGEVKACFINNSNGAYEVKNGDRIAQLDILKTEKINFVEVDELSDTNRGENGFGSSGK